MMLTTKTFKNRAADAVWPGRVVFVWAVLALATDLKSKVPYVHWAASFVVILLIAPYLLRERSRVRFPGNTATWLLIASVCLPIFYGAAPLYSMAEAAKLAIILAGGLLLFTTRSRLAHYGFDACIFAVLLNVALLIGGFIGLGSAVPMAAAGRWGTILSFPGSLWRVGITIWIFAAYLLVKQRSLFSLLLLLASTLVIYADGARTGFLLVAAGGLYLLFVLAVEWEGSRAALLWAAVGVSAVALALLPFAFQAMTAVEEGGLARITRFSGAVDAAGFQGLEVADAQRFLMLQTVLAAIKDHPVFGTGILTTTVPSIVGPQPIHMTYLEVWADMGLLGLAAYVCLVWGWIPWIPRAWRNTRALSDPRQRALFYNALFLLAVYGVAGLFHPLSTEWSEWVVFIVPYALVYEITRSRVVTLQIARVHA